MTAPAVELRETVPGDLPFLFRFQLDPEANRMAAFTVADPSDRAAFDARWERILGDPGIVSRTVLADGEVVGSAAVHPCPDGPGEHEVTYWIAREHWGRGIAGRALAALLAERPHRPLYARAARDNHRSLRVLDKCGFVRCGEEAGYAAARGEVVEEYVLVLR
ncbi:GNAT family N-acetyltransferase [Streptomyces fenghuangensis]|uniref:GNAT family N-acetyltransferase n=1 Tax=Streptomyces chitinivorans TaxID=1257027 RepID=A0ABW7HPQ6_9ACTN|nr:MULTISPECIES: GNAT family N-acetyltransferase [Streptomyces]MCG3043701.1 GNAT family N-acetyltransferase [Streptomyces sp. ICN903]MDH2409144.1 GNAT family N-acetyltransferase [Streptomyces chitinivorans]